MGHKVSPLAFRIGFTKTWKTTGYAEGNAYARQTSTDIKLRVFVQKFLKGIPVANVFLNHLDGRTEVIVYSSKVSLVMGNNDENTEKLKNELVKRFGGNYAIEVREVKKPELSASIVADSIARQIEKKMPYRRVIKMAIAKTLEKGGLGIKVILSGRLNGADIARRETYKEGNIPTQTLRADIEYTTERAETMYGTLGLKVWIYKGDIYKS